MGKPSAGDELQTREQVIFPQGGPSTVVSLRVHRAVTWIRRAEQARDDDGKFLFLWIAFDAICAEDRADGGQVQAWEIRREFFRKIARCQHADDVSEAVWERFFDAIAALMESKYVFGPFWKHSNGVSGYANWKQRLRRDSERFRKTLMGRQTQTVLLLLFDRLYVLRNQLLHGGATCGSSLNRDSVEPGTKILGTLVPIFVHLMLDHPKRDWGRPHYLPGWHRTPIENGLRVASRS